MFNFKKVLAAVSVVGMIFTGIGAVPAEAAYKDDVADIMTSNTIYSSMIFGLNTKSNLFYDTENRKPLDSDCTRLSKTYEKGKASTSYQVILPEKALPKKYRKAHKRLNNTKEPVIGAYYNGKKIRLKVTMYVSAYDTCSLTAIKTGKKINCGTISKKYPLTKQVEYSVKGLTESDYRSLYPDINYIKLSDGHIYKVRGMMSSGNSYSITVKPVSEINITKKYNLNNGTLIVDNDTYTKPIREGDNIIVPLVDFSSAADQYIPKEGTGSEKLYSALQKVLMVLNVTSVTQDEDKIIIKGDPVDISEKACTDRLKTIWSGLSK